MIAVAVSFVFSGVLAITFGWIGTLLLNLPGVFFGMAIRASGERHIDLVVFLGDWVFYLVLFWSALLIKRRLSISAER